MNLRVRIKNPVFWVQIVLGAVATALAYAGLTAADLTSWPALWGGGEKHLHQPLLPVPRGLQRVGCAQRSHDQRPVGQRPRENL